MQLFTSPTEDIGKILASLARIEIGGTSDFSTGIQVAQLALKHRKNKNGGQRIIVFVGSPLQDTIETIQKLGKQLKKNNIAIDIVNIGECDENSEILNELLKSANSNDNR